LSAEVLAKAVQWTAAPVHPAKPPIAGCVSAEDAATCASDRARFQDKAWPAAWGGDHDAADTVAYCLTSSCDGGVQLNPIQGCAWRQVIVASKDPKVDEDDAYLAERECGMLTAEMRVTAKARAAEIFREIYKRDLGG
jgi:hypothetical protein